LYLLLRLLQEIIKHNDDDYLLDEIIKTRPITDDYIAYYKVFSDQYNSFTNDNMTIVTDRNTDIQDISDADSSTNNQTNTTNTTNTNKTNTITATRTSSTVHHTEKRHKCKYRNVPLVIFSMAARTKGVIFDPFMPNFDASFRADSIASCTVWSAGQGLGTPTTIPLRIEGKEERG
jgi:hypothetical protein